MIRSKISPKYNNKRKYNECDNPNEEEKEEKEEKRDKVTVIDNHIYFYADVNSDNVLELNKCILKLNKDLQTFKNISNVEYGVELKDLCIYLHINSLGGYVTDAFSVADTVINSKIPIYSIIEGYVASAATFISIVCAKRYMTKHSSFLIHQLSGSCWGTYQQMGDDLKNSTHLQKQIKKLYMEHSKGKLKKEKLDEFLMRDLMLSSKKCKKMGFVDEIM